ncbi:hypothetical protein R3P38DRAFT_3243089 [Favolaschia claudopus]|uniref:Uncharacterized protein n=1 Tax=Favolaschia claudopus TaxID=2862362 RepID=A0AAV9Z3W4_9AGAR
MEQPISRILRFDTRLVDDLAALKNPELAIPTKIQTMDLLILAAWSVLCIPNELLSSSLKPGTLDKLRVKEFLSARRRVSRGSFELSTRNINCLSSYYLVKLDISGHMSRNYALRWKYEQPDSEFSDGFDVDDAATTIGAQSSPREPDLPDLDLPEDVPFLELGSDDLQDQDTEDHDYT